MVVVAQLVRAPGCGPGGRGFESPHPPHFFDVLLYFPESDTTYVGQTDNIILRYYRHRDKKSQWTSKHDKPVMVHWEEFPSRGDAMKR